VGNGGFMGFKWDLNGTIVGYNQLLTIIGIKHWLILVNIA
jgi:hypothetical protein